MLPIGIKYTFFHKLEDMEKPVIAAIGGVCIGGGMELALACDLRLATKEARLGLGEVKLGVIPAGGGTARLPRLIGPARAKELLFFGDQIDGEEAARIGLVNKVVPAEELMSEAKRMAAELAERPPLSLKALKDCVNVGMRMDLAGALDYEQKWSQILAASEDRAEGMRAFIEKRKPVFKGR
jgi:enoyl-CoA hydratase